MLVRNRSSDAFRQYWRFSLLVRTFGYLFNATFIDVRPYLPMVSEEFDKYLAVSQRTKKRYILRRVEKLKHTHCGLEQSNCGLTNNEALTMLRGWPSGMPSRL